MKNVFTAVRKWNVLALGCAMLGACGAGSESYDATPTGDSGAYAEIMAYCNSEEPVGKSAESGGWSIDSPRPPHNLEYEINAIVSSAGAPTSVPMRLQVMRRDYRFVKGETYAGGYARPEWKMGIAFTPSVPPKSAACVAGLAKLAPVPSLPFGDLQPTRYTLNWRSKWSTSVPIDGVAGKVIDGFEFVSNFVPASAQAFFVLDKDRFASTQGITICHLAPRASGWHCATPNTTDAGRDWMLSVSGTQPGVYVLASPAAN